MVCCSTEGYMSKKKEHNKACASSDMRAFDNDEEIPVEDVRDDDESDADARRWALFASDSQSINTMFSTCLSVARGRAKARVAGR